MSDDNPYLDDTIIKVFMELGKVKESPRLLVLVAHGFIELLVNTVIDAKCKNSKKITSNRRDYPHSAKLLILNETGVLPDDLYRIFDWFRKLRNRAAHEPIFSVTKSDLSILKNKKYHDPENLYEFCTVLIGGFWNEHLDILGPVFAPRIMSGEGDKPKSGSRKESA
ncbi:MAG: hypothetical protein JO360_15060 [Acidobacteria bacterium]|nr:hypothetical protein [Acidobacteriota bacterium]